MKSSTVSKRFPVEERYALTDQIRRAPDHMLANLSKRGKSGFCYVAHFADAADEMTDADRRNSSPETQHWLETASGLQLLLRKRTRRLAREMLKNWSNARNNDGKA